MFKRSEWDFKATMRDGGEIAAHVTVDGWLGFTQATVDVAIEIDGEVTTRKGTGTVERKFGPHFPTGNPIRKITFSSIGGDVIGSGRTLKDAIESYGSEVLKIVVEQRRRAALVESAKAMQAGQLVSVELTVDEINVLKLALANFPIPDLEAHARSLAVLRKLDALTA